MDLDHSRSRSAAAGAPPSSNNNNPGHCSTAVEAVEELLLPPPPEFLLEPAANAPPTNRAAATTPSPGEKETETPARKEEIAAAAASSVNISKKRTATESAKNDRAALIHKLRKVLPVSSSTNSVVLARGEGGKPTSEERWNRHFELLREFHRIKGHCRVPWSLEVDSVKLGRWVSQQRCYYKRFRAQNGKTVSISKERIDQLNSIAFEWSVVDFKVGKMDDAAWNKNYELLRQYHAENGHARVPQRYEMESVKLGAWVKKQRAGYKNFLEGKKRRSLTQERIDRLNVLGFDWKLDPVVEKTDHAAWNRKFELLRQYHLENGHFRIPKNYMVDSVGLGSWVCHQRQYYTKFKEGRGHPSFTQERIDKLDSIGFVWRAKDVPAGNSGQRIRSRPAKKAKTRDHEAPAAAAAASAADNPDTTVPGEFFVGKRVAKQFGDLGIYFGIVKEFLPAGSVEQVPEQNMWEVEYDDGDMEDVTLDEMQEMLALYQTEQHSDEQARN